MLTVPSSAMTGSADVEHIGQEARALIERLYPFCRSLTGDGVRQTLSALQNIIPLSVHEVPTGTAVYDWVVPDEWNARDAYVRDSKGTRVIDFQKCNLHLVGYSAPIAGRMARSELLKHVFTNPDHPAWIPYKHFYYKRDWGFCVAQQTLELLTEDDYDVRIDTSLEPGHLSYGEFFLAGRRQQEVLISAHTCHPSLCNDNLSGIAVAALLARELAKEPRELSYRFLFVPATLGPLVWLSRNEDKLHNIRHGLVISGVGDSGSPTYMKSRLGHAEIDQAMAHVFAHSDGAGVVQEFSPCGYDQRQYCSPGFNLPVGCFMRTPNGQYPEYHTSADSLDLMSTSSLADSFKKIMSSFSILEANRVYVNLIQKGEPRLGPRGLFQDVERLGLFWTLNFSDGQHSLLDIADKADIPFELIAEGARRLVASGLLREAPAP
jgi:aminopeptidase-like protein